MTLGLGFLYENLQILINYCVSVMRLCDEPIFDQDMVSFLAGTSR